MLLNNYARPAIREIPMIEDRPPYVSPFTPTPTEAALFRQQWLAEAEFAGKWPGWEWYRELCLANAEKFKP